MSAARLQPEEGEEGDQYSNSSRAHLAHGLDPLIPSRLAAAPMSDVRIATNSAEAI